MRICTKIKNANPRGERRAIREKIETKPKIRNGFRIWDGKYLSQELALRLARCTSGKSTLLRRGRSPINDTMKIMRYAVLATIPWLFACQTAMRVPLSGEVLWLM